MYGVVICNQNPAAAPLLAFLQTRVLNENGWLLLIDNSARAGVEASVLRAPSNYIEFLYIYQHPVSSHCLRSYLQNGAVYLERVDLQIRM